MKENNSRNDDCNRVVSAVIELRGHAAPAPPERRLFTANQGKALDL